MMFLGLDAWVWWVIIALAFIVLEVFTTGFAVACFSIGAVAAAILAALGLGLTWQLVAFSVFTIIAFLTVRPFVIKHFYNSGDAQRKSNADALIGSTARVTETIIPDQGKGRVAVDGDDWKAVSENAETIQVGEKVIITHRDSIILTVKKA